MTEAQTWTVIGVLAATLIGTCGLMARFATNLLQQSIGRVLDQIDALDQRIEARFTGLDYRFELIDRRFEMIDHRFEALEVRLTERIDALDARIGVRIDALDSRIDVLDRDVQAIANRAFGGASAAGS
ncbi:hypothetical protein G3T36_04990 [Diaminobutyricibacter tongyongensis]|uniref:Uncharacterized protein n=1 Tax=Leifsonia tongyongensis TaxID=1268043 RepID=A0A6L9XUY1_9MICO|nr:hypothetical protein [Diaminobutyricibacter tongyongensis]NEN05222.1 hypothetical protein [Diaminobutyricibacter tongyongensis]